jgi:isoleucyl-tRNA synthetase
MERPTDVREKMDYRGTLNLPRTDFPMKAELARRELEIQRTWEEIDLYRLSLGRPEPRGVYVLHDGPPYSNGDIHLGHALNKILKDFVVKYKTMQGYVAPFVPGWDNHGMPIENEVTKQAPVSWHGREQTEARLDIRRRCREYAHRFVDVQREQFKRLGIRGDWGHPYLTMSNEFEASIVRVFGELAARGYIYRGQRSIHWCPTCVTALAEAEIEYEETVSPSIWLRFPLVEDPAGLFGDAPGEPCYALIWTTTPWTIPANVAVAVNPDLDYVIIQAEGFRYLLAEGLLDPVSGALDLDPFTIVRRLRGTELSGLVFRHPIFERESPVILGEHVTLEQGTGCVHIAPGHGPEDFELGRRYDLWILCPVDEFGVFTDEARQFAGLNLEEGDKAVVEALRDAGTLLKLEEVTHQYPHCWRCRKEVIFRSTEQWFINIDHHGHRAKALESIGDVEWYPEESENRIRSAVEGRPDWCISRQRAWGVGIPAFFCRGCGEPIIAGETIAHVAEIVERESSDAWFEKDVAELLPSGYVCPHCGGSEFRKETDILDVWFDSGSTHLAVLETTPGLHWPADLYLEGTDQHRGWFNASLMIGIAVRGAPPYRAVVTNGFTVDAEGRGMHKSLGNVISPFEIIDRDGADVVRLWVASSDYFRDIRSSDEILQRVADAYRKFRNTFRFLLGNLYDYDPETDRCRAADLLEIDRWALSRLQRITAEVEAAYEEFEYHRIYQALHNFCAVDLSSFYLDVLKDRLYTFAAGSEERRAAQTVIFELACALAAMLAPILSHTAEEVWMHMPSWSEKERSVQLTSFPKQDPGLIDEELEREWQRMLKVRAEVLAALEAARGEKLIGSGLDAKVVLAATNNDLHAFLELHLRELPTLFIVSQVDLESDPEALGPDVRRSDDLGLAVEVRCAEGQKCPRCWNYRDDIGAVPEHPTICGRCGAVVMGLGE